MTPALNAGSNRLSAISVQSLADVGYRVDASQADPFTLSLSAVAPLTPGPIIDLRGDTRPGPIPEIEVDKAGRVVRVIRN